MREKFYKFIKISSPLITYVLNLEKYPFNFDDFEQVKENIYSLFDEIEKNIKDLNLEEIDLDEIIFPLISYVDEKILISQWRFKNRWISNMLQKKYYGANDNGENFYKRFEKFEEKDTLAKLIYIYFLNLGFKGKHYTYDKTAFEQFMSVNNDYFCSKLDCKIEDDIYLYSYRRSKPEEKKKKMFITKRVFIFSLLGLLYILFAGLLYVNLQQSFHEIKKPLVYEENFVQDEEDSFDKDLYSVFTSSKIKYKQEQRVAVLNLEHTSFVRKEGIGFFKDIVEVDKQSQFANNIDAFLPKFLNFIEKYKNEIEIININSYASSEYRSEKSEAEMFSENLTLTQNRGDKTKEYIEKESLKINSDLENFVKEKFKVVAKGSNNLIYDKNGEEDKNASRRIEIEILRLR